MKRSEALEKIRDILLYKMTEPDLAVAILEIAEEVGMCPPPVRVHTELYLRDSGQYGWDEYIWEAE